VFESGKGYTYPDLPEAFDESQTREFGGESGALPAPENKLNFGLAEMQFPAVLMGLHSSVSS